MTRRVSPVLTTTPASDPSRGSRWPSTSLASAPSATSTTSSVVVPQRDRRQLGADELAGARRDEAQDVARVVPGQQRAGDLRRAGGPGLAQPRLARTGARSRWRPRPTRPSPRPAAGRPRRTAPPPRLSVRYRFPNTSPRTRTGTPRKVCIGGWWAGKPDEAGCWVRSASRSGCGSRMSTPRMPRPRGSGPMRARVSSSIPTVMNCASRSSGPSTPSAPYCASTSRAAASTIRRSSVSRSRSALTAATASSSPCRRSRAPTIWLSCACS